MKPSRITLQDQIRDIINEQPASPFIIARLADIHKSQMSRFMTGAGGLSQRSLNRLASVLGLVVTSTIKIPPAKKGRPVSS